MKGKKLLSLVAISLATALCATACAPAAPAVASAPPAAESKAADASAAPAGDAKLDPVTLTWYVVGSPQNDQAAVMEKINEKLKEKLNVTLDLVILDWGVYDDKIKIIIGANEKWDLCFTSSWSNDYAINASKGAYLELDEYMDQYAPAYKAQVPEKYMDATKIDGKMYGFINYQNEYLTRSFTAQQELLNKHGLDKQFLEVKKWQDLEPILEVIKQKEPSITPLYQMMLPFPELFNRETGFSIDFVQGNSMNPLAIRTDDATMKAFNGVESPEFMELAKLWRSWYEKGYIKKDQISRKDYMAEMSTGTYGVISAQSTTSFNNNIDLASGYMNPSFNFKTLSTEYVPNYVNTGSVIAALTAINRNSENKERAVMLFNLMHEDKELYNMICYGLEGKHYTHTDADTITPIPDAGYVPAISWEFGNTFNGFADSAQKPGSLAAVKKNNDEAVASPLLGFIYSAEAVKQEDAQVSALLEEYVPAIVTGSVDPEKAIPELVTKMNAAGMDKIITNAQTQIDKWRAANGK